MMDNIMRREAMRVLSQTANTRMGIVTSYDKNNYCAKVQLQPEGVETGWLPIGSGMGGNGFGDFYGPIPGDVVYVNFQEGGKQAGYIGGFHFGDQFRPLPVPSGERWTVHKSGSGLKFLNDGTVELTAATAINSSAPVWNHTGLFIVDGEIKATGDIFDRYTTNGYTMASFRATYDTHRHGNVTAGSDFTDIPNEEL